MTDALKETLAAAFGQLQDIQLMGLTIFGEARGEIEAGRIAVGSVILERVKRHDWEGRSIHEVCLCPYQFSCYLPSDPNFAVLKMIAADWEAKLRQSIALRQCLSISSGLVGAGIPETPEILQAHCCQYITIAYRQSMDAHPELSGNRWWQKMKLLTTIGNQEFYA